MSYYLDVYLLAQLIRQKQGDKSLRELERATGVGASTFSRLLHYKNPDIDTFLSICDWLEVSPGELFKNTDDATPNKLVLESLEAQLIQDSSISSDFAHALINLIAAYRDSHKTR